MASPVPGFLLDKVVHGAYRSRMAHTEGWRQETHAAIWLFLHRSMVRKPYPKADAAGGQMFATQVMPHCREAPCWGSSLVCTRHDMHIGINIANH
jgi:hypothetical protein